MRIRNNKKGMSLVELIAVMVISVVVVGAALVALYGGSRGATDGSADYANHGDAYVFETWLRNNLPTAQGVSVESASPSGSSASADAAYRLAFDGGGVLQVTKNGNAVASFNGIQSFAFSTEAVGSRQTFQYVITAAGGGRTFRLTGGIVLNNVSGGAALPETELPAGGGQFLRVS